MTYSGMGAIAVLWRKRQSFRRAERRGLGENRPMAGYTYVLTGLRRRYALTLGAIRSGVDRAQDLAHLGAVITMFNPGEDLSAIVAVRPHRPDRGHWVAKALTVLRTANAPLSAREIARRIMAADGIPPTDHKRLKSIECSLYATLGALEGDEVIAVVGRPKRWAAN